MKKKFFAVAFAIILMSSNLFADLGEQVGYEYEIYGNGTYMITYLHEYGTVTYFSDGRPPIIWRYGQGDLPIYGILGKKIKVFPVPSPGGVSVQLQEKYIKECSATSATFKVYNSEEDSLGTFIPESIDDVVNIPAEITTRSGTYFIKCIVTKQDTELIDEFTIPFIITK